MNEGYLKIVLNEHGSTLKAFAYWTIPLENKTGKPLSEAQRDIVTDYCGNHITRMLSTLALGDTIVINSKEIYQRTNDNAYYDGKTGEYWMRSTEP